MKLSLSQHEIQELMNSKGCTCTVSAVSSPVPVELVAYPASAAELGRCSAWFVWFSALSAWGSTLFNAARDVEEADSKSDNTLLALLKSL